MKTPLTAAFFAAFLALCPAPSRAQISYQAFGYKFGLSQRPPTTVLPTLSLFNKTVTLSGGGTSIQHPSLVPMLVGKAPALVPMASMLPTGYTLGTETILPDDGQVAPAADLTLAVIAVNLDALADVNGDANYVNEDGSWNVNPYAATATATAPAGRPDVPKPAAFTGPVGVRGGANQGYIYYFDYTTCHVWGSWVYSTLAGAIAGSLHYQDLAEGTHTGKCDFLGTYADICVCNQTDYTYVFVEGRRKKKGVVGARTGRLTFVTSNKYFNVTSANNYAPSEHGQLNWGCTQTGFMP